MDDRILDFIQRLPTPSKSFNDDQFYAKGATILEEIIDELLIAKNINPPKGLNKKIISLKSIDRRPVPNKAIRALHSFRRARNEYIHNTRVTSKGKRIEKRFIASVEKACQYNGRILFPISCPDNQRQWRLYFSFTILWEFLKNMAKPVDDFYPTRELINAMFIELHNAIEKNS